MVTFAGGPRMGIPAHMRGYATNGGGGASVIGGVAIGTTVSGGDFGAGYTMVGGDDYNGTTEQRIPRPSALFPSTELLLDSAFSERDRMQTSVTGLGITSGPYYTGYKNANQGVIVSSFSDIITMGSSELRLKLRELDTTERSLSGPRTDATNLPAVTDRRFAFPAVITSLQAGHYGERILEGAVRFSGDWSALNVNGPNWNPAWWGLTVDGASEASTNPDQRDERDYFEALNASGTTRTARAHIRHSPGFNQASQAFSATFITDQWRYFRVVLTASNVVIKVFSDAAMTTQVLTTLTFTMSSASLAEIEYVLWDQVVQTITGTQVADLAQWVGRSVTMHVDWWRVWALTSARVDAVPTTIGDQVVEVAAGGTGVVNLPTRAALWPFVVADERIQWWNGLGESGPGRGGDFTSSSDVQNNTPSGLTVDLTTARTVSIASGFTGKAGVMYGALWARPAGGAGIAKPYRFAIAVGPTWSTVTPTAGTIGAAYSFVIPTTAFDVGNLWRANPVSAVSLPAGFTFDPATRTLATASFSEGNVTLRVTNGRGQTADTTFAVAEAGGAFLPETLPGYVAAWDANDATRVPDAGGGVSASILNRDGTTQIYAQGTAGSRPGIITNGGVGANKRVLTFDGAADHHLSTLAGMVSFLTGANFQSKNLTWVLAIRCTNTGVVARGGGWYQNSPTTGDLEFLQYRATSAPSRGFSLQGDVASAITYTVAQAGNDTNWHVVTLVKNGSSLAARVDGVEVATATQAQTSQFDATLKTLGAHWTEGTNAFDVFWPGEMAAEIIVNGALSGTDLTNAEAWCAAACGL